MIADVTDDGVVEAERLHPALARTLRSHGPCAIAVSGGVDSLTLAAMANALRLDALAVHAVSPAVPPAATARTRRIARERGWRLRLIDAGEFGDERYRANPANRCFFCKSNLYGTMGRTAHPRALMSGTNTDDLGDWRPGLRAAESNGVRHPYVEAGLAKADVRALATALGLPEIAALPASPCLSSRVETGLRVEPADLRVIDAVEQALRVQFPARTVRCRRRSTGWVIETDSDAVVRVRAAAERALRDAGAAPGAGLSVEPYRRGSAFLREHGA